LFILAMLLTPPDVMTQILMAVPLILLYEFCVWFLYFSEGVKGRRRSGVKPEDAASEKAEREETQE
ncbi:MAG TPA: hypothetical protein VLL07_00185, partial [Pontiella sp.]|nr:hypothetical protein [Pontiella sp.]